ncbi:MAG: hypothetical protein QGH60_07125 [Phycisphaerae bacterium]|jgi:hypothetical protein|nr:hypothetical protein [Phycisphaerae bacterium]
MGTAPRYSTIGLSLIVVAMTLNIASQGLWSPLGLIALTIQLIALFAINCAVVKNHKQLQTDEETSG